MIQESEGGIWELSVILSNLGVEPVAFSSVSLCADSVEILLTLVAGGLFDAHFGINRLHN